MCKEDKAQYIREAGWFFMFDSWHHPFLAKELDLDSAYLYERFKRQEEESFLFDDDMGS